jgi:hypothetical protein
VFGNKGFFNFFFAIEKGLKIHLGVQYTSFFLKKDPEYKAYYTYTITRINKHHQASPPAAVAPNFVEERTNIEAQKKSVCHNQRTAPRFGIAARINATSPLRRT